MPKIIWQDSHNDRLLIQACIAIQKLRTLFVRCQNPNTTNQTMVLKQVVFEPGKSHINDTNKVQLDELILILKENQSIKLEIGGYTDMSGIPEKNVIISQDRAKSVYNYLIENGIAPNRLSHQGYGSAKPIAPNKYRWGRDKNRRIEIKVVSL